MDLEREFTTYKNDKRQEIITMSTIISTLADTFNEKEKDLLLRSYIVLSYAYWESCFHKFQSVVFEKYIDISIDKLPFEIKNQVYLHFARMEAGINKKKVLQDIDNYMIFSRMNLGIESYKNKRLMDEDYSIVKKNLLEASANPNLDLLKKFLRNYNIDLNEIICTSINDDLLPPYFTESINFIIKQRNAIAHKNEKISINDEVFETYYQCINYLIEYYSVTHDISLKFAPEEFISEFLFNVDSMFRIVIQTIDEKRRNEEKNEIENN